MPGFWAAVAASASICCLVGPWATRSPGAACSSMTMTRLPPSAAASAADRPATPAPITSTSGWRLMRSMSRGASDLSEKPRPATRRITPSAIGHANFGLMPAL